MNGIKAGSVPRTTSENLFRGGFPVPNSRKAGAGSLANELSVRLWEERRHLESLHSVVEAEQGNYGVGKSILNSRSLVSHGMWWRRVLQRNGTSREAPLSSN